MRPGVLFSHGARFGGHALYIKDGKLKYAYNWVGMFEQIVESTEPITTGPRCSPPLSSGKETRCRPREPSRSTSGKPRSAKARIKTQPGKFSIAGEGLNIGKDTAEPVTDDYAGQMPWPFTGGTIERAVVDVSGEPFIDLAQEAAMAFARD